MAIEDIFRRPSISAPESETITSEELAEKANLARSTQIAAAVLYELKQSMDVDTYPDIIEIERTLITRGVMHPDERLYNLLPGLIDTLTAEGNSKALEVESLETSSVPDNVISITELQSRRQDTPRRHRGRRIARALAPLRPH